MKYSEFKEEVEVSGFEILEESAFKRIYVLHNDENVGFVATNCEHTCETAFYAFYLLSAEKRKVVLDIVSRLALTPLAEREEEKRYWLRFIHPKILCPRETFYLHLHHSESAKDYYDMGTVKVPFGNKLQTIFTESEIAEMDITGFEKIEVKDE